MPLPNPQHVYEAIIIFQENEKKKDEIYSVKG
jgi:hypothetical protein